MTKVDNALKVVVIECLKSVFQMHNLSIERYAENNSYESFTVVNNANNINNIVCEQHEEFLLISVVNEDNKDNIICSSCELEKFDVNLSLDIDNELLASLSGFNITEAELIEAGFDAREIFDDIKRLQQKFSTEQE